MPRRSNPWYSEGVVEIPKNPSNEWIDEHDPDELAFRKKRQRARISIATGANGIPQASISITIRYELLIAFQKMMEEENFDARVCVLELIEEGLVRRKHLPEWWRARGR